jgi:NAD(P)-dependent dehydrogenase (short-subunit alcohol dehydrogenase family)
MFLASRIDDADRTFCAGPPDVNLGRSLTRPHDHVPLSIRVVPVGCAAHLLYNGRNQTMEDTMLTVLVTGASRGIGLALTESLANRGDVVIATCRDPDSATELQALAARDDIDIDIVRMDVTDFASIEAAREEIGDIAIDVVVNNAGVIGPERQSTLDMDFDGWRACFEVNTLAPLKVAQVFLSNLRLAEHGRILTVSSRMGSLSYALSDKIAYRSSKAAVNKVMQGLATDLKGEGIAVSVCHPGWVKTGMGGQGADMPADRSAAGLTRIIDRMRVADSPRFYNYDGSELAW